jgi:hypothetical protein
MLSNNTLTYKILDILQTLIEHTEAEFKIIRRHKRSEQDFVNIYFLDIFTQNYRVIIALNGILSEGVKMPPFDPLRQRTVALLLLHC